MKNKILIFTCSLIFTSFYCINLNGNAHTVAVNAYRAFVTPENLLEEIDAVSSFYDDNIGYPERPVIYDMTLRYISNHLNAMPNGAVAPSSVEITRAYDNTYNIDILGAGHNTEFQASFLQYQTGKMGVEGSSSSSFQMTVPNGVSATLIVVKAITESVQTGLFIIIIDKDILRPYYVLYPRNMNPSSVSQPRKTLDVDEAVMDVFPNPLIGDHGNLSFGLFRDEDITISIIEASSGKILRTSNQFLTSGHHVQGLDLTGISSGNYYIELKTMTGREIRSLIKLE